MSSKPSKPLSRRDQIRRLASSPRDFSRFAIGIPLRPYQQEVADSILHSILNHLGLSFVVIFPRQSGKNETQAHIQAYLLCLLSGQDIEMISVSPTYKPQALNAMRRLQRCLDRIKWSISLPPYVSEGFDPLERRASFASIDNFYANHL